MSDFWQILQQILSLDFSSLYEFSPLAIFFIILFTTFLTEDGACIAAGALAGQGRISFALALSACFAGILIGDIGLYWIGRGFGKSISKTKTFSRFVSEKSLETASEWLNERGATAIFISRFVPSLRLPTYLAAGFLRTSFPKFAFYFLIATAIWTPAIVYSAATAQEFISPNYLLLGIIFLLILIKLIHNLSTWKRRRLFIGKIKKIWNWEFWSLKIFYFPVVFYVVWLAIKHRGLTVFTCANPSILASGFIGESKHKIYEGLKKSEVSSDYLLKHKIIFGFRQKDEKFTEAKKFIDENKLGFPIVLKPDVGERGKDVFIAKSFEELEKSFEGISEDYILQEFAKGDEISIFYYQYPSKEKGRIFSITEKEFPKLIGDGKANLEELILKDRRAVCLAKSYFERNAERLDFIPQKGEKVQIVDIGTHSRGAIFNDGGHLKTEKLENKIDEICRGYKGFYFGRFDIRTPSFEDLKNGENFKIIELNGVTSESTNIYDKRYSLFDAYKILFKQWKIAFEIGEENFKLSAKPTSVKDLLKLLWGQDIGSEEDK